MVLRALTLVSKGESQYFPFSQKTQDSNNTFISPTLVESLSGLGMRNGSVSNADAGRGGAGRCRINLSDSY